MAENEEKPFGEEPEVNEEFGSGNDDFGGTEPVVEAVPSPVVEPETIIIDKDKEQTDYHPLDVIPVINDPKQASKKLDLLVTNITASVKEYSSKRNKNKNPALIFKVLTTLLSAIVTILLGFNFQTIGYGTEFNGWTANIALSISALTTVVGVWGTFFDYNKLWVKYQVVVLELEALLKDITYIREGNSNIQMRDVNFFKKRYNTVLADVRGFINKVRSDDTSDK